MFSFILSVGFGLLTVVSYYVYDQLVCLEYEEHKDAWNADGKPNGFFWSPSSGLSPSAPFFRKLSIRGGSHFLLWLSVMPAWMRNESRVKAKLRWCRILFVVGLVELTGSFLYGISTS